MWIIFAGIVCRKRTGLSSLGMESISLTEYVEFGEFCNISVSLQYNRYTLLFQWRNGKVLIKVVLFTFQENLYTKVWSILFIDLFVFVWLLLNHPVSPTNSGNSFTLQKTLNITKSYKSCIIWILKSLVEPCYNIFLMEKHVLKINFPSKVSLNCTLFYTCTVVFIIWKLSATHK